MIPNTNAPPQKNEHLESTSSIWIGSFPHSQHLAPVRNNSISPQTYPCWRYLEYKYIICIYVLYILLIHGLPQEASARRSSPPTSPTSSISRVRRVAASPEPEAPEQTAVPNGVRRRALEDGSMGRCLGMGWQDFIWIYCTRWISMGSMGWMWVDDLKVTEPGSTNMVGSCLVFLVDWETWLMSSRRKYSAVDSCCQHLALFTLVVVLWCSLDMRIRSPGNRMP